MSARGRVLVPAAFCDEGGEPIAIGPGDLLAFHRVRGRKETWTVAEGGPLELHLIHADGRHETRRLEAGTADRGSAMIAEGSLRAARLAPGAKPALLRRSLQPGGGPPRVEVPTSDAILKGHPLHRRIVAALAAG